MTGAHGHTRFPGELNLKRCACPRHLLGLEPWVLCLIDKCPVAVTTYPVPYYDKMLEAGWRQGSLMLGDPSTFRVWSKRRLVSGTNSFMLEPLSDKDICLLTIHLSQVAQEL